MTAVLKTDHILFRIKKKLDGSWDRGEFSKQDLEYLKQDPSASYCNIPFDIEAGSELDLIFQEDPELITQLTDVLSGNFFKNKSWNDVSSKLKNIRLVGPKTDEFGNEISFKSEGKPTKDELEERFLLELVKTKGDEGNKNIIHIPFLRRTIVKSSKKVGVIEQSFVNKDITMMSSGHNQMSNTRVNFESTMEIDSEGNLVRGLGRYANIEQLKCMKREEHRDADIEFNNQGIEYLKKSAYSTSLDGERTRLEAAYAKLYGELKGTEHEGLLGYRDRTADDVEKAIDFLQRKEKEILAAKKIIGVDKSFFSNNFGYKRIYGIGYYSKNFFNASGFNKSSIASNNSIEIKIKINQVLKAIQFLKNSIRDNIDVFTTEEILFLEDNVLDVSPNISSLRSNGYVIDFYNLDSKDGGMKKSTIYRAFKFGENEKLINLRNLNNPASIEVFSSISNYYVGEYNKMVEAIYDDLNIKDKLSSRFGFNKNKFEKQIDEDDEQVSHIESLVDIKNKEVALKRGSDERDFNEFSNNAIANIREVLGEKGVTGEEGRILSTLLTGDLSKHIENIEGINEYLGGRSVTEGESRQGHYSNDRTLVPDENGVLRYSYGNAAKASQQQTVESKAIMQSFLAQPEEGGVLNALNPNLKGKEGEAIKAIGLPPKVKVIGRVIEILETQSRTLTYSLLQLKKRRGGGGERISGIHDRVNGKKRHIVSNLEKIARRAIDGEVRPGESIYVDMPESSSDPRWTLKNEYELGWMIKQQNLIQDYIGIQPQLFGTWDSSGRPASGQGTITKKPNQSVLPIDFDSEAGVFLSMEVEESQIQKKKTPAISFGSEEIEVGEGDDSRKLTVGKIDLLDKVTEETIRDNLKDKYGEGDIDKVVEDIRLGLNKSKINITDQESQDVIFDGRLSSRGKIHDFIDQATGYDTREKEILQYVKVQDSGEEFHMGVLAQSPMYLQRKIVDGVTLEGLVGLVEVINPAEVSIDWSQIPSDISRLSGERVQEIKDSEAVKIDNTSLTELEGGSKVPEIISGYGGKNTGLQLIQSYLYDEFQRHVNLIRSAEVERTDEKLSIAAAKVKIEGLLESELKIEDGKISQSLAIELELNKEIKKIGFQDIKEFLISEGITSSNKDHPSLQNAVISLLNTRLMAEGRSPLFTRGHHNVSYVQDTRLIIRGDDDYEQLNSNDKSNISSMFMTQHDTVHQLNPTMSRWVNNDISAMLPIDELSGDLASGIGVNHVDEDNKPLIDPNKYVESTKVSLLTDPYDERSAKTVNSQLRSVAEYTQNIYRENLGLNADSEYVLSVVPPDFKDGDTSGGKGFALSIPEIGEQGGGVPVRKENSRNVEGLVKDMDMGSLTKTTGVYYNSENEKFTGDAEGNEKVGIIEIIPDEKPHLKVDLDSKVYSLRKGRSGAYNIKFTNYRPHLIEYEGGSTTTLAKTHAEAGLPSGVLSKGDTISGVMRYKCRDEEGKPISAYTPVTPFKPSANYSARISQ